MSDAHDALELLMGQEVVLDVTSPFVYVGTLCGQDHRYLILADVDVHDLRDTNTNRELYIVESKRHGVRTNRKRALVNRDEIVSISALSDILD